MTSMTLVAFRSSGAAAARKRAAIMANPIRSITIGTDMLSSVISLQKARPWHMSDATGSNQAADNAVSLKELFSDRTVVLFGVPAPFTGTCTKTHYPPYKKHADDIIKAGADEIVCYSVTDPYAHRGWEEALGNDPDKIKFLADPDAKFARAYGLDVRYDACSLGLRSKRFSMIVANGTVQAFRLVTQDEGQDAAAILEELKEMKENEDLVTGSA
jgi:glutaredoxin/glutathione-dependent peroxiredoxin